MKLMLGKKKKIHFFNCYLIPEENGEVRLKFNTDKYYLESMACFQDFINREDVKLLTEEDIVGKQFCIVDITIPADELSSDMELNEDNISINLELSKFTHQYSLIDFKVLEITLHAEDRDGHEYMVIDSMKKEDL